MFSFLSSPYSEIADALLGIAAIVGAIAYAYSVIKSQKSKADSDTIASYKSELEIIKSSNQRMQDEVRNLTTQVNQLIGENRALKSTLALRDPRFESKFTEMLEAVKTLGDCMKNHYEQDDKHVQLAVEEARENRRILLDGFKQLGAKVS